MRLVFVILVSVVLSACGEAGAPKTVETVTVKSAGPAEKPDTVTLYNRSCISCHSSGAAGAPRTHDTNAWAPRLDKGMDTLVASTINGIGAMPPKGMCVECSDEDYRALIIYMSSPAPAR